jgi:hypothetical protein
MCIPVSSHSRWTSRNMRNPGLGQGRQRLAVALGCQEREIRPCSSPMTASRDAAVPMRLRISYNADTLPAQWVCPGSPRMQLAVRHAIPVMLGRPCLTRTGRRAPGIGDLGSLTDGLTHGHGRGLYPPGWAVSYRLTVVLSWLPRRALAAARVVRPAAGASVNPAGAVTHERPRAGLHGAGPVCRRSGRCRLRPAPRRWSGTDTKTGRTLRPGRRRPPGCPGVQPQTFGCGSPEAYWFHSCGAGGPT